MGLEWLSTAAVLGEVDQGSLWAGIVFTTTAVMGGTYAIVKAVIKHRERMAKIGMGIDPDMESRTGSTPSETCCR
jgi:hypothetical protein